VSATTGTFSTSLKVGGISPDKQFEITKSARATITSLTDGASIAPDFDVAQNFAVTLGGNRTLANPSNIDPGQTGSIFVVQDTTGGRTLSFGSYWKFLTECDVTMFGFSAFSELPFSTQENNSVVALSGLSLDIDEGIVTVIANAVIEKLTGLGLDIDEGTVTIVIAQNIVLTGESLDIDEGTATVDAKATITLTGESLDIDEGTVTVTGTATVVVTGESADIILGQYPVWIVVPVGPADVWTTVSTGALDTWTTVTAGPGNTWTN
jgi:hypothetical protein